MSPEQAGGDLDRLGPRSDVYSLRATLYCLLTGRPPFEGDDIGEIEPGRTREVPRPLVERLARFHFLDNVRRQTSPFRARAIEDATSVRSARSLRTPTYA
jgi:serine/threonine protein kinase